MRKPVLIVIAGPNGSGKTSTTRLVIKHEWAESCEYINPDEVAQSKFGDWNDPNAVRQAVEYCEEWREQLLKDHKDFIFETVLSSDAKVDFLKRAKLNAIRVTRFADRVYFYDNSVDNQNAQLLFRTTDGKFVKQYIAELPQWTESIIEQI